MRVGLSNTTITSSPSVVWKMLGDPTLEIKNIIVLNEETVIICHAKLPECREPLKTSAMHLAVLTTSHARIRLYRILQKVVPEDVIYVGESKFVGLSLKIFF